MNMLSIQCITFDSENPSIPGKFWSEALGWQISISNDEEVVVEEVDAEEESTAPAEAAPLPGRGSMGVVSPETGVKVKL